MPTPKAIEIQKAVNKATGVADAIALCNTFKPVECYSTDVASLDKALGAGLPKGRIIELFGPESSGKTTTMLNIMAAIQAINKENLVGFIDVEHALDLSWAAKCGCDIHRMLISQPSNGEEVFNIIDKLIVYPEVALIVIDSVPALQPQDSIDKIDKGEDDNTIAAQAKLMSKGLRGLNNKLSTTKTNAPVVFINQIRQKIQTGGISFGNNEFTPGGLALKFYTSIRMDIRKASTGDPKSPNNKKREGAIFSKIKVIKNKVAPPFQSCEIYIHSGSPAYEGGPKVNGIDKLTPLVDVACELGIFTLKGSNYYLDNKRVAAGKLQLIKYVAGNEVRPKIAGLVADELARIRAETIANPDKAIDNIINSTLNEDEDDETLRKLVEAEADEA